MEKLVHDGGPPSSIGYETLKYPQFRPESTFDEVGLSFISGTIVGFFYNFIKGNNNNNNSCGFRSRFSSALAKSPGLGANFAWVSLGHSFARAAYFQYIGEPHHGDIIPYQIHCAAFGGTVGFANHGLGAASVAAVTTAGLMSWAHFYDIRWKGHLSSICKTNTYTYPHYRLPHPEDDDHILLPQALLYDSKLPEY